MALHLFYNPARHTALLSTLKADDVVIIVDEALLQWSKLMADTPHPQCAAVYALSEECQRRQLDSLANGVSAISFADWIALTIEHPQQVNWV